MQATTTLALRVGTAAACRALGVSRATCYRRRRPPATRPPAARPPPPRALAPAETQTVLDVLHSPRFVDQAPPEVYATLLDEGRYLCSVRSMYRLLARHGEVRERRNQCRHPRAPVPQLLALAPNEVWSWDITKLRGPVTWTWYYLYVVLDIFSRYVVGWLIAPRESAALAERLLVESCAKQAIVPGRLTVHADRGTAMTSRTVAQLLVELGVARTHSRPRVSNDNPYSEAQFKTLKYRPTFPDRFGSLEDARAHCQAFFHWYNEAHHHSGIALMTPADIHHGRQDASYRQRHQALTAFWAQHPERFVRQPPQPPALPSAAWINPPVPTAQPEEASR